MCSGEARVFVGFPQNEVSLNSFGNMVLVIQNKKIQQPKQNTFGVGFHTN
jgi:hypothetical protein